MHPKAVKEDLALEITARLHSTELANEAKATFDLIFSQKQIPSDLAQMEFSAGVWIAQVLKEAGLSPSTSQARRDIKAGGVKIDQEVLLDEQFCFAPGTYVVQVGKRKFLKAIIH
ncbi:hypothetical protein ASB1_03340 [Helicobacter heilmannii]|nr:hypothetical protein ASB1_03340 [Helicobacter heilmannii]